MPGGTRVGFIGLSTGGGYGSAGSWASKAHLPYFQSDRNGGKYKITALQNSSKGSSEKSAKELGLGDIACYGKAEEIANDPNVDVVAVSVKVPQHYDAIVPALKAGKDVFVEWPLARNLQDAEELTALANEKKLKTLIGLQARHNPSVVAVKKLVEAGELGEILGTAIHAYGMVAGATESQDLAYGFPIEAGANLLTIPFGHGVDAMCYVLGELAYVSATLANRRPRFSVTDREGKVVSEATKTSHDYIAVNGTLQKSGGVVSVVYEGGMNPTGGPSFFWQINGTKGAVVLEGAVGHVQMYQPKVRFARTGEEAKELEVYQWADDDFSYAVGEGWNAFAGKGDGHVTTFEDALLRHKMIEAIYKSNENGKREKYI